MEQVQTVEVPKARFYCKDDVKTFSFEKSSRKSLPPTGGGGGDPRLRL